MVVVSLPDEVYGHTGNADSAADFIFACLSAFADVPREDVRVVRGLLVYPGTQGQLAGGRSPRPIWTVRLGSSLKSKGYHRRTLRYRAHGAPQTLEFYIVNAVPELHQSELAADPGAVWKQLATSIARDF